MNSTKITTKINKSLQNKNKKEFDIIDFISNAEEKHHAKEVKHHAQQLFYGYRRQKQEIAELKKRLKKKDEFWLKSMANVFKLEKEIKHKNKLFEKWGEENKKLKEENENFCKYFPNIAEYFPKPNE